MHSKKLMVLKWKTPSPHSSMRSGGVTSNEYISDPHIYFVAGKQRCCCLNNKNIALCT